MCETCENGIIIDNDFDGDGVADELEHQLGWNPLSADSNGDGIPDNAEDTDSDGLTDAFEARYSLKQGVADAGEDADSDGLTNLEEQALGFDPTREDTDGDGLTDFEEYRNANSGGSPLTPNIDFSNLEENWATRHGLDLSGGGLLDDADADGLTNLQEYLLGTAPNQPQQSTQGSDPPFLRVATPLNPEL